MSASTPEGSTEPSKPPLALPASEYYEGTKKLNIDETIKLDELGPIVVNSDGTLSRISNWKSMTEHEKERIVRVLGARNKLRIANEEKRLRNDSSGLTVTPEVTSNDATTAN